MVVPGPYGQVSRLIEGLRSTNPSSVFICLDDIGSFPFTSWSCESSGFELLDDVGDADDQCAGVSASDCESGSSSIFGTITGETGRALGLWPGIGSTSTHRYCFEDVVLAGAPSLLIDAAALVAALPAADPSPAVAVVLALTLAALVFFRMYGLKRHSMPWPEHLSPFLRHLKHSGSALSQMTRRVRHSRHPGRRLLVYYRHRAAMQQTP